jgi:hypothetical protein
MAAILVPVLVLIGWTFVMWLWMYATRIPAMGQAKIDAAKIKHKQDLDILPTGARQVADNYNHLHEQPTVFYALAFLSHLTPGAAHEVQVMFAWAYVGLRIAHSLWQATVNYVPLRFVLFSLSTLVLMGMALHLALPLFG